MSKTSDISLDEALIENLVRAFYTKVRADAELGPIFADKIGDDWEPHLQTMFDFWSAMMLKTGRYNGRPMPKHMALNGRVTPDHFKIWLKLFETTALDVAGDVYGPMFVSRAERIARSFQSTMFFNPADIDPARQ